MYYIIIKMFITFSETIDAEVTSKHNDTIAFLSKQLHHRWKEDETGKSVFKWYKCKLGFLPHVRNKKISVQLNVDSDLGFLIQ